MKEGAQILRRGFTLIELLVVIAIIAILAAILFPVFAQAREKSRQTACLSTMKQISVGFQMYLGDYDGKLPGGAPYVGPSSRDDAGNWVGMEKWGAACTKDAPMRPDKGALFPYVKNLQVYLCPSSYLTQPLRLSYSVNCLLTTPGNLYTETQMAASKPGVAGLIFMIDESKDLNDGFFCPGNPKDVPDAIHLGGANYAFADGHVKFFRPNSISVQRNDPGPFYPDI